MNEREYVEDFINFMTFDLQLYGNYKIKKNRIYRFFRYQQIQNHKLYDFTKAKK